MKAEKHIPIRTCIGCRQRKKQVDVLRFTLQGPAVVLADPTRKASGRGFYLCRQPSCLEDALKSRGLHWTFRKPISQDAYSHLESAFGKAIEDEKNL